jgi:hypothetical protein
MTANVCMQHVVRSNVSQRSDADWIIECRSIVSDDIALVRSLLKRTEDGNNRGSLRDRTCLDSKSPVLFGGKEH